MQLHEKRSPSPSSPLQALLMQNKKPVPPPKTEQSVRIGTTDVKLSIADARTLFGGMVQDGNPSQVLTLAKPAELGDMSDADFASYFQTIANRQTLKTKIDEAKANGTIRVLMGNLCKVAKSLIGSYPSIGAIATELETWNQVTYTASGGQKIDRAILSSLHIETAPTEDPQVQISADGHIQQQTVQIDIPEAILERMKTLIETTDSPLTETDTAILPDLIQAAIKYKHPSILDQCRSFLANLPSEKWTWDTQTTAKIFLALKGQHLILDQRCILMLSQKTDLPAETELGDSDNILVRNLKKLPTDVQLKLLSIRLKQSNILELTESDLEQLKDHLDILKDIFKSLTVPQTSPILQLALKVSLSTKSISMVNKALSELPVTVLNLSGSDVHEEAIHLLEFPENSRLTHLVAQSCNMNRQTASALLAKLPTTVTNLDLSGNQIRFSFFKSNSKPFMDGLARLTGLKRLELNSNPIGDRGISYFGSFIPTVSVLGLNNTGISNSSIQLLTENKEPIAMLRLGNNHLKRIEFSVSTPTRIQLDGQTDATLIAYLEKHFEKELEAKKLILELYNQAKPPAATAPEP